MLENLVIWISTVIILSQALSMFVKSDRVDKSISFLLLTFACAVWSIGLSAFLISKDVFIMRTAAETYYIAAAGIVWSAFTFSLHVTNHKHQKMLSIASFFPFLALSLLLILFPNAMLVRVNVGDPNTIDLGLTVYAIYALYFTLYTVVSCMILAKSLFGNNVGLEKRRLTYILLSYLFGLSFGALFNLILPLAGNYTLIWVGPISVSIFAFFIYMSTRSYRLFHAGLLFSRILILAILIAAQGAVLFTGLNILGQYIEVTTLDIAVIVVLLSTITIMVAIRITKLVDQQLGPRLLNSKLLGKISHMALKYTNREQLVQNITEMLTTYLDRNSSAHICLYSNSKHICYDSDDADLHVIESKDVRKYVDDHESSIIITEEIKGHKSVYKLLASKNISTIVRISDDVHENDICYGYLIICTKRPRLYSDQEVDVLATIGGILTMAVRNIRHYEKIENFNSDLKREVDNATHSLQLANKRLVKLNEAKDEFLSLASHQLRTPLTSVKGYVSMLLEGDFGDLTPQQRKIVNDVYSSSQQMVTTIGDFLDTSRIQANRFTICKSPINLAEILKNQIDQLKHAAKVRNISLVSEIEHNFPIVELDGERISQVMMNLIDNAIYYSPKDSSVMINLYTQDKTIVFTVRDHGIGVPDKEKYRLFTKFYRAENAKTIRPDGTGVGLYIARKVIVAHHGQIIFNSNTKGSVFGFKIPM